ncbi:MAG: hypothetical protein ACLPX9_16165 [Rhodomicrobium sp.]
MVNAQMVNGTAAYFPPPSFCESFATLGRFLRLQNTIKYICSSRLNRKTAHPAYGPALPVRQFRMQYHVLKKINEVAKHFVYNCSIKGKRSARAKRHGKAENQG